VVDDLPLSLESGAGGATSQVSFFIDADTENGAGPALQEPRFPYDACSN
jgi:hypothetical protein